MQIRFLLVFLVTVGLASAETLADVQARMDKAAAGFQSLTAKVKKITYTAVIKDTATEMGTFVVKRLKGNEIRVRMEIASPDPRSISLSRKKYEVFLPKINTVQEYDLKSYGKLVDQFLLLGFGTPVAELKAGYDMKLVGTETINGQPASHLHLTPKAANAREHIKLVEMWIPMNDGNAIQQKFLQPSGDYFLSTYSDVKVNGPLSETDIALRLPKDVKREKPQK